MGENKDTTAKNGFWIYLDEGGNIAKTGHFKNNLKDGWWRKGTSGNFTIYRKGKVVGHGKGCWCCPDF
ncbi:MAG: hypothetical protein EOP53_06940 [Sphingobacteriales bacterium]|nr:MAG: hypothetical protein EOP53_06940 [Sphingobacteriales bacterium]